MTLWKNLVVALVAAFALAACSSSDNGTDTSMPTDPPPTQAEQDLETLQDQIAALRAQLGITDTADDLGDSIADLMAERDRLQGQLDDAADDAAAAAMADMTATGKALFTLLNTFDPNPATVTDAEIAENAPVVTAVRGAATVVTAAALDTFSDAVTSASNEPFTAAQTDPATTLPANNGFSGTMLTSGNTGRAETMTVFTDIAASSSSLFSQVYGGGTQTLDPGTDAHKGVKGSAFDGRTGGQVVHAVNAKRTQDSAVNDQVKLPGYYQGAAGDYTCTPATGTCATSVSADGITFEDTGADPGWMFTADNNAMVSVADSAYMTFGWWTQDDKNTADILDHVAVFYSAPYTAANGADINSGVNELTGKAKYEGGAAGKYAWRDRVADTAHGGHFTAKAELTADFDTEMMSGSISDFRTGDDGTMQDWTVTLSAATITDGGQIARVDTGANVVWAVGSSKADAAGSWEAHVSNSGTPRNDNLPTGVAGAFNAEFNEQGRMIGAFGTNITNPNPPK